MATPKKLLKTISLTPKKILQPRREQLLEQIQKDGTYLPKGIYHADLDRGMLDFVKKDLGISVNGKVVNTVDVLITTQSWAQFTQTWNFQDLDLNIKPPFVATVRKPETPYGTNQGATNYRIPGRPLFQYALVPNFDGARNGMDVYKIPQPTPVDITYEVKIFTNRMRELNAFNLKVLDKFSSRQAYVLIKGRYLPIVMDSISDESVVELQKRRYFIQNYTCNSTILGGVQNEISGDYIVHPTADRACGDSIVGGRNNKICWNTANSSIVGGACNIIYNNSDYSTIVGGSCNRICDDAIRSNIFGGCYNCVRNTNNS